MTIIDRAARAIQPYEPRNGTPRDVAIDLASENLLAPDLPQPNLEHDDYIDFGDVWIELDEPQRICTEMLPPSLSAQESEALGLALLAAAQHAKGQA